MRQMSNKVLRTILCAAVALQVVACGSNRTATPVSGGNPLSASKNAASGPLLGAWWDSSHKGLRTVYGVVGAAYQGAPTFSDGTYTSAAACMRKNIALLTTGTGALYSVTLPQGNPFLISSSGILKASIVFSPSCTSSLVFAPGNSAALLVQGLLSTPSVTPISLPPSTAAAAVGDTGLILLAATAADGTSSIQLLGGAGASPQPITILTKFGGMSFLPGTDSALLADSSANTVVEASHLTSGLSLASLAGAADGVSKPSAVAVSADGTLAAIANNGGSSVLRLDLSGQSMPIKTVCKCSPTELEPLAGNLAFRLNEPGSGTLWAFDGNGPQPRVLFIPSDQTTVSAQGASR